MRRHLFIALLLAGITFALYWPAGGYEAVFYDDAFFTDNPVVQSGLNGHSFLWALTAVVAANWHPVTTLSFVLTHQCFGHNAGAEHLVNAAIHALNAGLLFLVLVGMTDGGEKRKWGKQKAEMGAATDREESGRRETELNAKTQRGKDAGIHSGVRANSRAAGRTSAGHWDNPRSGGKRKAENIQHPMFGDAAIQQSNNPTIHQSNIRQSANPPIQCSAIQQSSNPTIPSAIGTEAARGDARPTTGGTTGGTLWRCAVVAAIFAWHPLRVESVAWIAERKDVLCGFFFLLTLLAWGRYVQKAEIGKQKAEMGMTTEGGGPKTATSHQPPATNPPIHQSNNPIIGNPTIQWWYWAAVLFFALALLSKAMAVTLPFVLLLLDIWPLDRKQKAESRKQKWQRRVIEKWPFFALTVIFCVLTFLIQRQEAATASLQELGLGLRLENVIVSYLRYLGWSVWPANLAMFYSFPYDSHFYLALWPGWQMAAGALVLAGVSVLCLTQIVRRPYLAAGWFWYLGMMVPVIGFVQVGSQGMADRYTYLPLIGPVISLVWLAAERWRTGIFAKALLVLLTTAILAASLVQTRYQLQFWKNNETLCRHTIEVTGENPRAEYIAGLGLENAGRIEEAMAHYRKAVSAQPRVKEAFYALARLLGQQGNWSLAEQTYATMLGDDPNDFTAHLGLATALPHLGRSGEAEAHLKTALEHCPDTPDALNNLAWTLATSGTDRFRDGPRAVALAERACQLTDYRETIMIGTLAAAYAEAGRFDEAVATAQKACALASELGKEDLLKINRQLLESYRQRQPYREPAGP